MKEMKIVGWLMTFALLFSILLVPGCAPQGGGGQGGGGESTPTLSCEWVTSLGQTPIGAPSCILATVKKGDTPQGNVTVAFEIVSGPHCVSNLGPDESYEIGELVYACAGPAPSTLISEYWKREKVYSTSSPVVYCKTDCGGAPAQFEYTGIKSGTDTIVVAATIDGHELEDTTTMTWQYPSLSLDVNGPVRQTIDMGNFTVLEMKIEIQDPEGSCLLNIGNSPTNDGGGGDYGDFANDSELTVSSDATYPDFILQLHANDYFSTPGAVVANLVPLFPPSGNVTTWILRIKIADQKMCALVENTGALRGDVNNPAPESPYIFRLGGADKEAVGGQNDYTYYAAFNRVIYTDVHPDRTGSGVTKVTFLWRNTWPGWLI